MFGKKKVKDVVCGMEVDKTTVHKAEHLGNNYYFCSADCEETFIKEPLRYLEK